MNFTKSLLRILFVRLAIFWISYFPYHLKMTFLSIRSSFVPLSPDIVFFSFFFLTKQPDENFWYLSYAFAECTSKNEQKCALWYALLSVWFFFTYTMSETGSYNAKRAHNIRGRLLFTFCSWKSIFFSVETLRGK